MFRSLRMAELKELRVFPYVFVQLHGSFTISKASFIPKLAVYYANLFLKILWAKTDGRFPVICDSVDSFSDEWSSITPGKIDKLLFTR